MIFTKIHEQWFNLMVWADSWRQKISIHPGFDSRALTRTPFVNFRFSVVFGRFWFPCSKLLLPEWYFLQATRGLRQFCSWIIFRRFSPRMVFFTGKSWPPGTLLRIHQIHSDPPDPPETKSGQAESTQGSPAPGSRMTVVCHKLPQIIFDTNWVGTMAGGEHP